MNGKKNTLYVIELNLGVGNFLIFLIGYYISETLLQSLINLFLKNLRYMLLPYSETTNNCPTVRQLGELVIQFISANFLEYFLLFFY